MRRSQRLSVRYPATKIASVAKHAEPEDVLYAMITLHRKDASNAF
jgi:hypothetical protein